MKNTILLFAGLLTSVLMIGQDDITFLVKDDATDQPIENAFLFIENTSIGTVTDQEGNAQLSLDGQESYTLVVTHILFKTFVVDAAQVTSGLNVISLVEKEISLNEVTIKSKRVKSKKRKKWLKRFEKSFFGDKVSKRKIELLNPEVLWFEEVDEVMKAYAVDNLKIFNKDLGYQVQFALEEFSLSDDEDVKYRGKLFFEDAIDEVKRKKKVVKKRKTAYRQSSQLFFRSLVNQHPINEKLFEYGIAKADDNGEVVFYPTTYDSLDWRYGVYADTLLVDDYLTVVNTSQTYKALLNQRINKKFLSKNEFVSSLSSRSGKFVISHDGYLINQDDIEESGFWASLRMAQALPISYTGDVIFNDSSPKVIVERLLSYPKTVAPEKVYVHTDKDHYYPYEIMWFKAYLVDGVEHSSEVQSSVVYVDLINQSDTVVQQWMLHRDLGFKGDFQWTSKIKAGKYRIRAYTNYMRNQSAEFFFEKEIVLDDLSNDVAVEAIDKLEADPTVSFYPEGGDLILGKSTQLTFHVQDASGEPLDLSGSIYNSDDEFITNCKTIHQGIGITQFIPERMDGYYFKTRYDGEEYKFPLPKVYGSGFVLTVNPVDEEEIIVSVASTDDMLLEDAFLIGHARGEIFTLVSDLESRPQFKISKSDVPQGVLHFTIFDGRERPQAERLVFNGYNYNDALVSFEADPMIGADDISSTLSVSMDSLLMDDLVDASMSVIDISKGEELIKDGSIKDYLLLESDLPVLLSRGSEYLRDIDDGKRFYLDLILRSQMWRRFVWRDLLTQEYEVQHQAERGYSISGHTTKKDATSKVQSEVMITALGPELVYDKVQTDELGSFNFGNLSPLDSITYIIQARINKNGKDSEEDETKIKGNRLVDLKLSSLYPELAVNPRNRLSGDRVEDTIEDEEMFEVREEYYAYRDQDSVAYSLDGPEINIKGARRSRTSLAFRRGYIDLDYADWVKPSLGGTALLSKISPRLSFVLGDGGKMYALTTDFQGQPIRVPMQLIIDGMGADPRGSNPGRFLGLRADDIKTISVGVGFAVITTRRISRTREKYLESGIIHFDHPGYSKAREFSAMSSNERTSYSSLATLLWESDVAFDENGKAILNFQPREETSSYVVKLQGVSASGRILSHSQVFSAGALR